MVDQIMRCWHQGRIPALSDVPGLQNPLCHFAGTQSDFACENRRGSILGEQFYTGSSVAQEPAGMER